MKNFFKTTLYLFAFAIAGILFQISCSNSDGTESEDIITGEKFVFVKKDFALTGEQSIWISNFDGTDQSKIPISLPSNLRFYTIYSSGEHTTAKLSKDNSTILFTVQKVGTSETYVYSCGVDGSNLQEVIAAGELSGLFL